MLKRPKKYLQLCVVTLGFGWSFGTYAQNLSSPVVDVPPPPVRNEPLSNKKTDPAETYNMGDPDPLYPGGAQPGSGVSVGASPGTEEIPPLDINQTTPPPELTSESSSAERTTIPSTPPVESEPTVPMEFMTEAPPPAPPEAPAQQPVAEVKSKKKKKKTARMKVSPTAPENPDDPDSGLEGRLHQVFKNYNSSPTPNESWDKASASRASETYQIQKNDTLWDISTTLFGDPSYWPKVWALNNPLITNPHLIAPGQAVKFYPGTAAQPPTVEVAPVGATNPDGTPVAPEGGTPPAEGEGAPPPVLAQVGEGIPDGAWPPPKKPVVPLITSFPKSIPVWEMASKVKMDRIKIDLKPRNIKTPMMPLGYYVTNSSLEGVGEVEEMENGLKTAGEYQYIYVKIEGAASQGDRYYIADSLGKIATG
ncbi:MAG: LysM peptidoglycan-binding domain-containing protein, partial [Pseudobdellovibrionaceae bacterium]